jgi:hypothetical protein
MEASQKTPTLPLGRLEYLGQVLHLVEHNGRLLLVGACRNNEPLVLSSTPGVSANESRAILHAAVDLALNVGAR